LVGLIPILLLVWRRRQARTRIDPLADTYDVIDADYVQKPRLTLIQTVGVGAFALVAGLGAWIVNATEIENGLAIALYLSAPVILVWALVECVQLYGFILLTVRLAGDESRAAAVARRLEYLQPYGFVPSDQKRWTAFAGIGKAALRIIGGLILWVYVSLSVGLPNLLLMFVIGAALVVLGMLLDMILLVVTRRSDQTVEPEKLDRLTLLNDITPPVQDLLRAQAIASFEALAGHNRAELHTLLAEAAARYQVESATWPYQARLAQESRRDIQSIVRLHDFKALLGAQHVDNLGALDGGLAAADEELLWQRGIFNYKQLAAAGARDLDWAERELSHAEARQINYQRALDGLAEQTARATAVAPETEVATWLQTINREIAQQQTTIRAQLGPLSSQRAGAVADAVADQTLRRTFRWPLQARLLSYEQALNRLAALVKALTVDPNRVYPTAWLQNLAAEIARRQGGVRTGLKALYPLDANGSTAAAPDESQFELAELFAEMAQRDHALPARAQTVLQANGILTFAHVAQCEPGLLADILAEAHVPHTRQALSTWQRVAANRAGMEDAITAVPQRDALDQLAGIDADTAQILEQQGVSAFADLAHADGQRLQQLINAVRNALPAEAQPPAPHVAATWPYQAALAQQGAPAAERLARFQRELGGGETDAAARRLRAVLDGPSTDAAGPSRDDLTLLDGIDAAVAQHLNAAGIRTFADLAEQDVLSLQALLAQAGWTFAPGELMVWTALARLAAAGRLAEAAALQAELRPPDDLTQIVGIDTAVETLLRHNGIRTLADLGASDADHLQTILDSAAPEVAYRLVDLLTWPRQARLLQAGRLAELGELQAQLRIGYRADDLTLIEGIGPAIQGLLFRQGIFTYAQLAATEANALRALLDAAGPDFRLANHPETWPQQAQLARDGRFEALRELQQALLAGRPVAPPAPDDLTRLEGIGPKIQQLLYAAGLTTYAALAQANVAQLRDLLADAGIPHHPSYPESWPEQARLILAEEWETLQALQNELPRRSSA
jgi:predicted flap endonuclease-1-like 5' DNA nuclease